MPIVVPGFDTQQQVVLVPFDESDINTAITSAAADNWLVAQLIPNGSDMTILFTRNVEVPV